jgi:hypothetical protein
MFLGEKQIDTLEPALNLLRPFLSRHHRIAAAVAIATCKEGDLTT